MSCFTHVLPSESSCNNIDFKARYCLIRLIRSFLWLGRTGVAGLTRGKMMLKLVDTQRTRLTNVDAIRSVCQITSISIFHSLLTFSWTFLLTGFLSHSTTENLSDKAISMSMVGAPRQRISSWEHTCHDTWPIQRGKVLPEQVAHNWLLR